VLAGGLSLASAGGIIARIPLDLFFAAMATRLNGPRAAEHEPMTVNFVFTDVGETQVLQLENAVLHHHKGEADPNAVVTVTLTRELFLKLGMGQVGLKELIFSDELAVEGSRTALLSFFGLFDPINADFPIVTRATN
jgi:alkyl sulfatase BDS1-like metallo-beta-lactamase superfamily hydrolase